MYREKKRTEDKKMRRDNPIAQKKREKYGVCASYTL
jgi:hypothetical protein